MALKGECAQTDVCNVHGLFPGIARGRDTHFKGKSLILSDVDPSTCDDGKRCLNICLCLSLCYEDFIT